MDEMDDTIEFLVEEALSVRAYAPYLDVPYERWPVYQQKKILETVSAILDSDWLRILSSLDDHNQLQIIQRLVNADKVFVGVIRKLVDKGKLLNIINPMQGRLEDLWNQIWNFPRFDGENDSIHHIVDRILRANISSETRQMVWSSLSNEEKYFWISLTLSFENTEGGGLNFSLSDQWREKAESLNLLWAALNNTERAALISLLTSNEQQVGLFVRLSSDTLRETFWKVVPDSKDRSSHLIRLFNNIDVTHQLLLMESLSETEGLQIFGESDSRNQARLLVGLIYLMETHHAYIEGHVLFNPSLVGKLYASLSFSQLIDLTGELASIAHREAYSSDLLAIARIDQHKQNPFANIANAQTVKNNELEVHAFDHLGDVYITGLKLAWDALKEHEYFTAQHTADIARHQNISTITNFVLSVPNNLFNELFDAIPNPYSLLQISDVITRSLLFAKLNNHPFRDSLFLEMSLPECIHLLVSIPIDGYFNELRDSLADTLLTRLNQSPTEMTANEEVNFILALPPAKARPYWESLNVEQQKQLWIAEPARLFKTFQQTDWGQLFIHVFDEISPHDRAALFLDEGVNAEKYELYETFEELWNELAVAKKVKVSEVVKPVDGDDNHYISLDDAWVERTVGAVVKKVKTEEELMPVVGDDTYYRDLDDTWEERKTETVLRFQVLKKIMEVDGNVTRYTNLNTVARFRFIQDIAGENEGALPARLLKLLIEEHDKSFAREIIYGVGEKRLLQAISQLAIFTGLPPLTLSDEPRSSTFNEVEEARTAIKDDAKRLRKWVFWELFKNNSTELFNETYIRDLFQRVTLDDPIIVVDLFIAAGQDKSISNLQRSIITSLSNSPHWFQFLQSFPRDYLDSEQAGSLIRTVVEDFDTRAESGEENEEALTIEWSRSMLDILPTNEISQDTLKELAHLFVKRPALLSVMYQQNRNEFFMLFNQLTQLIDDNCQEAIVEFLNDLELNDQIKIFINLSPRVREIYLLGVGYEMSQYFFDSFLKSLNRDQAEIIFAELNRGPTPTDQLVLDRGFAKLSQTVQESGGLIRIIPQLFPPLPQREQVLALSPLDQISRLFPLSQVQLDTFLRGFDQIQTNKLIKDILTVGQDNDAFLNRLFPLLPSERQVGVLVSLEPHELADLLYALEPQHRDSLLRLHDNNEIQSLMMRLPVEDQPNIFVSLPAVNQKNFLSPIIEDSELHDAFWQRLAILVSRRPIEESVRFIEELPDRARELFIDAIPMAGQVEEFADLATNNELRHRLFKLMNIRQQAALHNASESLTQQWIEKNISISGLANLFANSLDHRSKILKIKNDRLLLAMYNVSDQPMQDQMLNTISDRQLIAMYNISHLAQRNRIVNALTVERLPHLFVNSEPHRIEILSALNTDQQSRLLITLRSDASHADIGRNAWQKMRPDQHLTILSLSTLNEEAKDALQSDFSESNEAALEGYRRQKSSVEKALKQCREELHGLQSSIREMQAALQNNNSEHQPYADLQHDVDEVLNNLQKHETELQGNPRRDSLDKIPNNISHKNFTERFTRITLENARAEIEKYRVTLTEVQKRAEELLPNTGSLQRDRIELLKDIDHHVKLVKNNLENLSIEQALSGAVESAKDNQRQLESRLNELDRQIKNPLLQDDIVTSVTLSENDAPQSTSDDIAPLSTPNIPEQRNSIEPDILSPTIVVKPRDAPLAEQPTSNRVRRREMVRNFFRAGSRTTSTSQSDRSLFDIIRRRRRQTDSQQTQSPSDVRDQQSGNPRIFFAEVDHTEQYRQVIMGHDKDILHEFTEGPGKNNSATKETLASSVMESEVYPSSSHLLSAIYESEVGKKLAKKRLSIKFEVIQTSESKQKIRIAEDSCIGYLSLRPDSINPEYFLFHLDKNGDKGQCIPAKFIDKGRRDELKRKVDQLNPKKLYIEHSAFSCQSSAINEDRPHKNVLSQ